MFELAARLIAAFYAWTHSYAVAIGLVAVVVMLVITPLTLKSTKGMLEMQRLQPEMRRLQSQFKGDRQQLNAEMMKLYQEHKVNPLASCLPLLAQMPIFIIMFRAMHGLIYEVDGKFAPKYLNHTSELYTSLFG
ncbi:MAG: membrane protein insertase YidC, partial [Actinobacteria bacterium]|nr:membrane protein insertase YidC [Actinomycetota bacterium]